MVVLQAFDDLQLVHRALQQTNRAVHNLLLQALMELMMFALALQVHSKLAHCGDLC